MRHPVGEKIGLGFKGASHTALQNQVSTFEWILLKDSPPVSLMAKMLLITSLGAPQSLAEPFPEDSETSSGSGLPPTPHHMAPHPFQVSKYLFICFSGAFHNTWMHLGSVQTGKRAGDTWHSSFCCVLLSTGTGHHYCSGMQSHKLLLHKSNPIKPALLSVIHIPPHSSGLSVRGNSL